MRFTHWFTQNLYLLLYFLNLILQLLGLNHKNFALAELSAWQMIFMKMRDGVSTLTDNCPLNY